MEPISPVDHSGAGLDAVADLVADLAQRYHVRISLLDGTAQIRPLNAPLAHG